MLFQILLNSQRVTSGLAVQSQGYSQVVWEQGYGLPTQCYSGTLISTVDTFETKLDNILISEVSLFQEEKHIKLGLSQVSFLCDVLALVFRFSAPPVSPCTSHMPGWASSIMLTQAYNYLLGSCFLPLLDITPVM